MGAGHGRDGDRPTYTHPCRFYGRFSLLNKVSSKNPQPPAPSLSSLLAQRLQTAAAMRYGARLFAGGPGRMPAAARGLCRDAGRLSAVREQSSSPGNGRDRGPLLLPSALSFSRLVMYCIIIYLSAFIRCMLAAGLPGLSAHGVCVRVFVLHSAA